MNEIFKYGSNPITFQLGDGTVMVNATEMAKPFKRRPVDWLNNQHTKQFINSLTEVRNLTSADLMIVRKGGNEKDDQGTWFHEDLAMEFARWLAPQFGIWCNDRIKELLNQGYTKLDSIIRLDLARMLVIAEEERIEAIEQKAILELKNKLLVETNEKQKPSYDFVRRYFKSGDTYDFSEVAKILHINMGRNKLMKDLRKRGILRVNNQPYQVFVNKDYFLMILVQQGIYTRPQTRVTTKGLGYLADLYNVLLIDENLPLFKTPKDFVDTE